MFDQRSFMKFEINNRISIVYILKFLFQSIPQYSFLTIAFIIESFEMLSEIKKYSKDEGIGFLLYSQQLNQSQSLTQIVRILSLKDLSIIKNRLDQISKSIKKKTFDFKLINPSAKNQEQVMEIFHQCYSLLAKDFELKEKGQQKNQVNEKRAANSMPQVVLNAVRLLVVGILVALFAVSLFSRNDWEKTDSSLLQNDEIQSQKSIPEENVVDQQFEHEPAKTLPDSAQVSLQKDYLITQNFKIMFSDTDYIQAPLRAIYDFLLSFLPIQIAYFLCAYIFWPIAWAIAFALMIASS